jgi:hypothetical protein
MKKNRKTYMKKYRNTYGDLMKMQTKEWFKNHPGYRSEYCKEWRKKHLGYHQKWQRKNLHHYVDYQKQWREKNHKKLRLYMRQYMRIYRDNKSAERTK